MQSQVRSRLVHLPSGLNQWRGCREQSLKPNLSSLPWDQPDPDASGCGGRGWPRLGVSALWLFLRVGWSYVSQRQDRHFAHTLAWSPALLQVLRHLPRPPAPGEGAGSWRAASLERSPDPKYTKKHPDTPILQIRYLQITKMSEN